MSLPQKPSRWLCATLLVATGGALARGAAAENRICYSEHVDFGGTQFCTSIAHLEAGDEPLGVPSVAIGMSAIGLPRGYYVDLYSGANYSGGVVRIYGSQHDLHNVDFPSEWFNANDRVRSFKVGVDEEPLQYGVCLYQGGQYSGERVCFATPKPGAELFANRPAGIYSIGSISFPTEVRLTLFRETTTSNSGGAFFRIQDEGANLLARDFPVLPGEIPGFTPYLAEAASFKAENLLLRNLLTNGDGSLPGMTGWTWYRRAGVGGPTFQDSGWTNLGGGLFQTRPGDQLTASIREQTIDLAAAGVTPALLAQQPMIYISERVRQHYCPTEYEIRVELLDAAGTVLAAWDSGHQYPSGPCVSGAPWTPQDFLFEDYPTGVRYIRWRDAGWSSTSANVPYGPVFGNATVLILPVSETPHLDNLVTNPSGKDGTTGWSSTVTRFDVLDGNTDEPSFEVYFDRTNTGKVKQRIDLWAQGLDPAALASSGLAVGLEYQSCTLVPQLTVKFLDRFETPLATTTLTADEVNCVAGKNLGKSFPDVPAGLRYLELEIGAESPPHLGDHFEMRDVTVLSLGDNLITNGKGEAGLSGWTTTGTWGTTTKTRLRTDEPVFVATGSVTRSQTIDLAALGYNELVLDDGPAILISEEYAADAAGGIFQLEVELLDADDAQIARTVGFKTPGTSWQDIAILFEEDETAGVRKIRIDESFLAATAQQKLYLDAAFATLQDTYSDFHHAAPRQSRVTRGASSCGNPGQKPCIHLGRFDKLLCLLQRVRVALSSDHTPATCTTEPAGTSYCNEGATLNQGWCYSQAISCCTAVTWKEREVTFSPAGSFSGRVHLGGVEAVVEKREPAICPGPTYWNPVKSILKNNYDMGSMVGAWWGNQYGDLPLMITANYFQVKMDSLHPYTNPCTNNLGYTVSDGELVAVDAPAHDVALETLILFTPAEAKKRGYYADIVPNTALAQYAGKIQDAVSGHQLLRQVSPSQIGSITNPNNIVNRAEGIVYVPQPAGTNGIDPTVRLPRCAVGLDKAKKELIVVAVNNGDNADGIKMPTLAQYLVAQGAYSALNLDGSGSCQLWFHEGAKDFRTLPSDVINNILPADRQNLRGVKFFRPVPGFLGFKQRLDGHGPVHDEN